VPGPVEQRGRRADGDSLVVGVEQLDEAGGGGVGSLEQALPCGTFDLGGGAAVAGADEGSAYWWLAAWVAGAGVRSAVASSMGCRVHGLEDS
jgi:hypothetical protein